MPRIKGDKRTREVKIRLTDAEWDALHGVTTENGKNSTLSDLVFVKVIDN